MEVDDDFGDLYSDVLLPLPSKPSKPPSPAPNPNPSPSVNPIPSPPADAAAAAATSVSAARTVDDDDDWLMGGAAPPTIDPTSNWADEEEETNTNPSRDEKSRVSVSPPNEKVQDDNQTDAPAADVADRDDAPPAIPGLDTAVGPTASDDWDDSDSEDDLKIVLNDTDHGAMDDLGYGDGDEEEGLVLATNDDQIGALDQNWGEEGAGPGGEGEGKEGEGTKGAGVGGSTGPGPSRIGYSNHVFHQHHSMYKVRAACLQPELLLICREFVYTHTQLHYISYDFVIVLVSRREIPLVYVIQAEFDKSNGPVGIALAF